MTADLGRSRRLARIRALLLLAGGLLGLGLAFAAPALAHASVVTSDPQDGARLKAAPHTVTVTFDEGVGIGRVGYLHVTDQDGRRVDARAAYHPNGDATKVADDLRRGLGDGTYTASFRVISADSHPVAGTIRFVVGNGPLLGGSGGGGGSTVNHATSVAFDVARWLSYAGLVGAGGAWVVLLLWPAGRDDVRARRIVWTGWSAAAAGAVLELLVQGPYSAGAGLGRMFSWSLLDDTLHTNYGQLHSVRLMLLGALAVLFARALQADARPSPWEAAGGLLGAGVAWTFSDAGHAATTSPAWLSVPIDMVHVLAMITWVGGLVMIVGALLPRREPAELRAVLPAFSSVAFAAVTLLAASGLYNAFRGIGTVDAIFTTTYGLLVVCKVVLLAGILAVANTSRRLVRGRVVAYAMTAAAPVADEVRLGDDEVATERLRRAVFVEALVALVVLGFSAVLVAEPRGKEALVAADRAPISATAPLGGGKSVRVTVAPGTHGPVTVTAALSDGSSPKSITATATQQRAQIGPLRIPLHREGAGVYDGSTSLPVSGRWEIDLVVSTSVFDATTTDVTIELH
jgi:copper transport protein